MLQRALGILLAVVMLVMLPAWEEKWQMERAEREWKEILLERFCEEVCIGGICTAERYLRYSEALWQGEKAYYIQMTEYQRAEDADGNRYWYCNIWEEIEADLLEQGKYFFAADAAVEFSAVASDGEKLFYGGRIRKGGG